MSLYSFVFACLMVGFAGFVCIGLTLVRGRKDALSLVWIGMLLSISLWSIGLGFMSCSRTEAEAIFWLQYVHYFGAIFIPATFLHFSLTLIRREKEQRKIVLAAYGICFLLQMFNFQGTLARVVVTPPFRFYTAPGRYYHAFTTSFALMVGAAIFMLWKSYMRATGIQKNQMRYIFFAMTILFISGSTAFFPVYHIPIFPFGLYFTPIYMVIVMYVVLKHRLMGIDIFFRKGLSNLVYYSICIFPCWIICYVVIKYWWGNMTWLQSLVSSGFCIGIIMLLQRTDLKGQILFRSQSDYTKVLGQLGTAFISNVRLKDLLKYVEDILTEFLDLAEIVFFLDMNTNRYELFSGGNEDRTKGQLVAVDHLLIREIKDQPSVIIQEEMKDTQVAAALDALKADVLIQIQGYGRLLGFCILRKRNREYIYSDQDVGFLKNLSSQIAIAVENAKAYMEIADLNLNLERKVKERTEQLEQARDQLQEVDRLKSDFFSNVSHELRTPLTMLVSPLESYITERESDEVKFNRYIKMAHENALYLLEVVNRLLDFAKIDAGRMTVHLGKGDVDELVRGVTSRFSEYGKKHKIDINVQSKGPQQGYFDHEMVKRIVNNLLSNAVKFVKAGGRIDVRVKEDTQAHIIEVEDTGPGIRSEDRDAIFDRFTQKSKAGRVQGTGIGLALSREYARLHKGDITVDSELGKGSSFRVTLQKGLEKEYEVKETETEAEEAKHIDLLGVTEEELPEITVPAEEKKEQKVLVVEDHQRLREYLASLFVDYQVVTASSGEEGLQAFLNHKPDVVISDVMMEKEDSGIELCRQVRQQEGGQEIPFIFLTARADIKVKIAGLEAGGVEYLTKPFNPLELRTRVKNLLSFVELNQQYKKLYEELEATKEQLIQSEKMASLGVLVRGIGHEIRNPLVFAKLRMGTLMDYLRAGNEAVKSVFADNKERLEAIEYAHERIQKIVTELQRFSTVSSSEVQRIDVKREVEGVLMLLAHELKRGIKVHQEYKGDVVLYGNTVQVSQLIMNLVQNAIHAIEREGEIWVQTESEGEYFIIKLRDNGAGIPEENLRRIWDTFFTTKAKGTGLGLYIVYNVAKNHHGDVSVTSEPSQGTEFTVRLKKQAPTPGAIF